jgi:catechol 2,3-dioxygenase-like lactoylglutathione lyase family enzyme
MNVFRRHEVDAQAMFDFYGGVLGFEQLATIGVGNGGVARFQAGASELKLTRRVARRAYEPGGVADATGLRLLSFFFPDREVLEARFVAHGLSAPSFVAVPGGGEWRALVTDPDGQTVELVVLPDASPDVYAQIEVGLTVTDLAKSRAFYADFVGLEPLGDSHDPLFDTTKHSFRHGSTIVSLRSFGGGLPADTGSGGIQYVVSDVERVDRLAAAENVTVDQPLSELGGFSLRTIWLDDPDGITNYFAETGASRSRTAP